MDSFEVRRKIQTLNQKYLGPLRNEQGLRTLLTQLEDIYSTIHELKIKKPYHRLITLEIESLVLSSLAVANSAIRRKESRGVHYRTDYPLELADFERSQSAEVKEGVLKTFFE
jgi:succinate dehydrogenase/fumarate reductase flavoprotein subunit